MVANNTFPPQPGQPLLYLHICSSVLSNFLYKEDWHTNKGLPLPGGLPCVPFHAFHNGRFSNLFACLKGPSSFSLVSVVCFATRSFPSLNPKLLYPLLLQQLLCPVQTPWDALSGALASQLSVSLVCPCDLLRKGFLNSPHCSMSQSCSSVTFLDLASALAMASFGLFLERFPQSPVVFAFPCLSDRALLTSS